MEITSNYRRSCDITGGWEIAAIISAMCLQTQTQFVLVKFEVMTGCQMKFMLIIIREGGVWMSEHGEISSGS